MSDRLTGRDRCGYSPSGKSRGCLLGRGHGGRHQYKPTPASQPCAGCAALREALASAHEYLESELSPCDPDCECVLHIVKAALAQSQPDGVKP